MIGGSEEIAKLSGIDVKRYRTSAMILAGSLSGLAGSLIVAKSGIGAVQAGEGQLFLGIAAVVIGGTLLSGGRGGILHSGQVILMAGEPGIGKSTILTQLCKNLSNNKILYVCGEENPDQIKLRAERLLVDTQNLYMVCETDVDRVLSVVEQNLDTKLLIIDSMQTITSSEFMGIAGSTGAIVTGKQIGRASGRERA